MSTEEENLKLKLQNLLMRNAANNRAALYKTLLPTGPDVDEGEIEKACQEYLKKISPKEDNIGADDIRFYMEACAINITPVEMILEKTGIVLTKEVRDDLSDILDTYCWANIDPIMKVLEARILRRMTRELNILLSDTQGPFKSVQENIDDLTGRLYALEGNLKEAREACRILKVSTYLGIYENEEPKDE